MQLPTLGHPDGLLEGGGNEAGEEEGAEGVHMEGHEVLRGGRVGDAGGSRVHQGVVWIGGVEGEAKEGCHGEEGVDGDYAV